MANPEYKRPQITLHNGKLLYNGLEAKVVFRKHLISIGCTDITDDAMDFIFNHHHEWLRELENYSPVKTMQEGYINNTLVQPEYKW